MVQPGDLCSTEFGSSVSLGGTELLLIIHNVGRIFGKGHDPYFRTDLIKQTNMLTLLIFQVKSAISYLCVHVPACVSICTHIRICICTHIYAYMYTRAWGRSAFCIWHPCGEGGGSRDQGASRLGRLLACFLPSLWLRLGSGCEVPEPTTLALALSGGAGCSLINGTPSPATPSGAPERARAHRCVCSQLSFSLLQPRSPGEEAGREGRSWGMATGSRRPSTAPITSPPSLPGLGLGCPQNPGGKAAVLPGWASSQALTL